MLTVLNSRSFPGKKDPSKTFYVCDLLGEDGQIATDVFVDRLIPVGSKVEVEARITNHKLGCSVYPVVDRK